MGGLLFPSGEGRALSVLRQEPIDWRRTIALALVGCWALFYVAVILHPGGAPPGGDFNRVWDGALRVREGQSLYVNVGDERGFYTWTTPLLAWMFVPLTYLPQATVAVAWMTLCFAAWLVSLWPARRMPGVLLFLGPLTLLGAWSGNIQPLMTAALVFGVNRPWGPLAVGASAALKVSPALLAIPWFVNGELRKVRITLAVAALLSAPILVSGIDHYPFGLSPALSLRMVSTPLWAGVALFATFAACALANTRHRWLASAVAVIASRPTLVVYDVSYMLVGLREFRSTAR